MTRRRRWTTSIRSRTTLATVLVTTMLGGLLAYHTWVQHDGTVSAARIGDATALLRRAARVSQSSGTIGQTLRDVVLLRDTAVGGAYANEMEHLRRQVDTLQGRGATTATRQIADEASRLHALGERTFELVGTGRSLEAAPLVKDIERSVDRLQGAAKSLESLAHERLNLETTALRADFRGASVRLLVVTALVIVVSILGTWTVLRSFRPLGRITRVVAAMGRGDLRQRVGLDSPDELGLIARAVDDALEQLDSALQAQKRMAAELIAAKDVAESATEAKSSFLATMSHEIRTPLNGVIGMTSLLLDTRLADEQRDFAETIRGSGEALLAIINDILDFSKIEAGRLELETLDFDLRVLVEDVVALLAPAAHGKGLEITSALHPDVPEMVAGDAGRLRQVLSNLVGNAVKFTQAGEVTVNVSRVRDTDGLVLHIEVVDTGPGISEAAQAGLFQPFCQADASTTRRFGGTGLGLAISRRLVELMGGRIGLESTPGDGCAFWIEVPLLYRGSLARELSAQVTWMGDARVLYVDDNATSRRVVLGHLEARRMYVETTTNGRDALRLLRAAARANEPFGLTIIDYDMPEMSGAELAQAINSDATLSQTRLVMLRTKTGRQGTLRAATLGVDALLSKPLRRGQLYECVDRVLGRRKHVTAEPRLRLARDGGGDPDGGSPSRVLVVEDNVVNQKVAVLMLERLGCRVDVAANGVEAVDATARLPFDLVLMDCQMPELDGFGATRAIREREGDGARLAIVAMTANAMEGDRERCLEAGMDDYLEKPVTPVRLKATLAKWLGASLADDVPIQSARGGDGPLRR